MRFVLLALCVVGAACVEPCIRHSDCPNQLVCQVGGCVMPPMDAEVPEGGVVAVDGSTDASGADVIVDAGVGDSDLSDSGDAIPRRIRDAEPFTDDVPLDVALTDGSLADAPDADGADVGSPDAGMDADTTDDSGPADAGDDT